MCQLKCALLGGVLALATQSFVLAQRPEHAAPNPANGYDWREAGRQQLGAQAIQQLAKDKILISNEEFKQVFTPYLTEDLPVFITSDSLLNGFHVLFEESVMRLEQANVRKLGGVLKFMWATLQTTSERFTGKPQLVAAAGKRTKIVIAVAMRLLGEEPSPLDPAMAALVAEEVKRIEAGQGRQKPQWLGRPDRGFMALDYSRYQPRGFYTKSPLLQRYFRAVGWLQSIPFRVSNDEELMSFMTLCACVSTTHSLADSVRWEREVVPQIYNLRILFAVFNNVIPAGDDLDVTALSAFSPYIDWDDDEAGIGNVRKELLEARPSTQRRSEDQRSIGVGTR